MKGFGWNVLEIDGHNINEIYDSLKFNNEKNKPKLIIANTIKGKSLKFAENKNEWHHSILTKKIYEEALKDINNG